MDTQYNNLIYIFVYPVLLFIIMIGFIRCFDVYSYFLINDEELRCSNMCYYIKFKGFINVFIMSLIVLLCNFTIFTIILTIVVMSKINNDLLFNIFISKKNRKSKIKFIFEKELN